MNWSSTNINTCCKLHSGSSLITTVAGFWMLVFVWLSSKNTKYHITPPAKVLVNWFLFPKLHMAHLLLVPLTGEWLNSCTARWDTWVTSELDLPFRTAALAISTYWFLLCSVCESERHKYREIQEMMNQLLHVFSYMLMYAIAVWHCRFCYSITSVDILLTSVILFTDVMFHGVPMLI